MSIQAVAWALEQDLPARPKLVLVSLANHANHKDGYCWLRAETIAQEASCSRRAVFAFIGDLIRNGYVRKSQRKGDDGKQRANDYWILFDRADAEWCSDRAAHGSDDGESEAGDDIQETAEIASEPGARRASGDSVYEPVEKSASKPVDKHVDAPGPSAPACTRIDTEEPSKTNPKKDSGARVSAPRGYRPPPPEPPAPQGSSTGNARDPVFVFEGTPAYEAWCRFKARENRVSNWRLSTTKTENGKTARGWYFPTLFPPQPQAPPARQQTADDDFNPFEKAG